MDIIDFHQHCVLSVDHIKDVMKRNNIEKSIQMPLDFGGMPWQEAVKHAGMNLKSKKYITQVLHQLPNINQKAFNKVKGHDCFEFVPWISILTEIDEVSKFDWFKHSCIIKIIPVFDDVDENYVLKLHDLIENLPQHIVMIHTGWQSSPGLYNKLIAHYPDKIFILAHMKEDDDSDNADRIAIIKKYENAYLELSYLSSPKRLKQYVSYGFEDQILFGSDFRTLGDEISLKWFLNAVTLCNFSEEITRKILYRNAKKLL